MITVITISTEEELALVKKEKTGIAIIFEGTCNDWCYYAEGVIIKKENRFLLNGTELMSEYEPEHWHLYKSHNMPLRAIFRQQESLIIIIHVLKERGKA